MIAYLEKIKENAQFYEIVDFLSRSSIFYALTVSPDVCASFIEQFWKTTTFKTINNISQIHAKVAGKPVVITEAPIRGDQPPLTESSLEHDSSQDPRVNLDGTCGVEGIRVLALETVKDAQAKEILTLKARIKKLEKRYKPARSILALKPLPTIDPKEKGKGVLEEPESAKKMTRSDFDAAQIARDEEIARQLEVELQVEVEKERQREKQASMNYIANLYDEVQERIDVDHELAVRWTYKEHEKYIVDEREKLLAKYFERRKKQLAEERAAAIKNKPPTKLN
nr:hypothetical protein [Tanacetum cinerariifolium]